MDEIKKFNEIIDGFSSYLDLVDPKHELTIDKKILIIELMYLILENPGKNSLCGIEILELK